MASVSLSSLTKYTDQLSSAITRESVLAGRTISMISIQTGVKYKDALNIINSTLTAQAGGCGAFSASGAVNLIQRDIAVCPFKVEESICLDEFEQYWIGQLMRDGSYNETAPDAFNTVYVADKMAKIQQLIDKYFWAGSTDNNYSNGLTLCDGIMDLLEYSAATNSVVTTTYSGALSAATAIDAIDAMVAVIPTDVISDETLTLFMGYADFRTYAKALRTAFPGFDFLAQDATGSDFTLIHPGTNVKVVATVGMNGLSKRVLTPAWNLVFGTDLERDPEGFKVWFDLEDQLVKFRAKWKAGAQVYFPAYIVKQ